MKRTYLNLKCHLAISMSKSTCIISFNKEITKIYSMGEAYLIMAMVML
jgi:hypothetical protein